jgi:plasmid stabilization system protein ParE
MGRVIRWTERASNDVEAIVRYVGRRDPSAAARIGQGIYDRVQILLANPAAGPILTELRDRGWRKLTFRRWKIVYIVREETIIIGRVWPAAMGETDLDSPL